MTIKKQILELLTKKELTALEISAELQIPKKRVWSYLSILKNEGKIETINDKKPYIYTAITPKALLKQLYSIMRDKMTPRESLNDFEFNIVIKIEELITYNE